MGDRTIWRARAACAAAGDEDRARFTRGGAGQAIAKRICETCPVREPCLWAAMLAESAKDLRYDVYGGLSANERTALARRDQITADEALRRLDAAVAVSIA